MLQLIITVLVGVALLAVTGFAYAGLALVVAMITFTIVSTSRWLDGRPAVALELLRLVLLLGCAGLAWQYALTRELVPALLVYTALNLALLPLLIRSSGFRSLAMAAQE